MDQTRPTQHLCRVAQQYPEIWKQVDRLRATRGQGLPAWPAWCFVPLAGIMAILTQGAPQPDLQPLGPLIGIVGALAAWRATQGIYLFDPDVCAAVWDTPLASALPTALLYRLPEWCCYVLLAPPRPIFDGHLTLHGFYVHLEWDATTHHTELRLLLDSTTTQGDVLLPFALHVEERGGLVAAVQRSIDVIAEDLLTTGEVEWALATWQASAAEAARLTREVAPLVSLTLYLCAVTVEFRDAHGSSRQPSRPQPTRTTKREWLLLPLQPTTWEVSCRLGAASSSRRDLEGRGP